MLEEDTRELSLKRQKLLSLPFRSCKKTTSAIPDSWQRTAPGFRPPENFSRGIFLKLTFVKKLLAAHFLIKQELEIKTSVLVSLLNSKKWPDNFQTSTSAKVAVEKVRSK